MVVVLFIFIIIAAGALFLIPSPVRAPTTLTPPASLENLIVVDSPLSSSTISSPLTITGKARGTWYFEASFPIVILGEYGSVLGRGQAQAQGDWMTEDFVPFKATITFGEDPATNQGYIVLKNDNPSGDPAKQKELDIPIVFK